MMKYTLSILALLATPALADDAAFSEGSEARPWGLFGETIATFSGTVVDLTCEVSGDCVDNCGDGARQLGIIRDADGVLVNLQKNAQQVFTGAVTDMLPYCGQQVEVDGLLVRDELVGAQNLYLVQVVRAVGDTEWTEANNWQNVWEAAHPEWAGDGRWYRRSGDIRAHLDTTGYFGLGLERDREILDDLYAE